MNPLSLREICAKATKGPWGYEFSPANKAYEIAPFDDEGYLDWSKEVCMTADDNEANAQLIARLSPATALAVYEALEPAAIEARALLEAIIYPGPQTFEQVEPERDSSKYGIMLTLKQLKALRRALALLDGRTEP